MINIVFEGYVEDEKKKIIQKLKKNYSNIIRAEELLQKNKKLYKCCYEEAKNLIADFDIEKDNAKKCIGLIANYIYSRGKQNTTKESINIFSPSYITVICNLMYLMNKDNKSKELMNLCEIIKEKEKKINLLVFFDKKDKRPTKEEKVIFKKIKDRVRYNNNEYQLLVIKKKDKDAEIIAKITKKIDEIIEDDKKVEDQKWYELYKIDIEEFKTPDDYIEHKLKYKKKFVEKVKKYAINKKVIETGCGTGLLAGYLQKEGLEVTALDLSKKVLAYAEEIAKKSNIIVPCKYKEGDILNLKYPEKSFDVSYSIGVLEHFGDQEIIKTLKDQMQISKYVIFGIPSTYFNMDEKMLGNERGLKLKEWYNLIKKAEGKVVEQTGFDYYPIQRRILEIKKWHKPKAFWLFVIEKNKEEK